MAYAKSNKLLGDETTYTLSDNIKKYALRDVGFVESKTGKFQLERSLDPNSPYNQGYKLKVTINPDMTGFKLAATTNNGLKEVNIFKGNDSQSNIEQFHYIMQELLDRQILSK